MKVLTAEIVGTLCGSGYPDKLTNQDALMGLYPAVRNVVHRERTDRPVKDEQDGRSAKLYARSASNFGGGTEDMETIVRRLTPLECERLQGFPDGWTDIGEWTDTNGKKHQPSDSPRYKALGNSIATPFWFYLLRRISAQYERPATLGSLFDGIGGFPYCWEMCNGKGTAVWASEIEEFPIAVTKRRFPEDGCAEEQVCCGDSQNVECGDEDEVSETEE